MSFAYNIQSVSKYESKLLIRSWFFKIFMLLAVFFLSVFNWAALVAPDSGGFWAAKAITSNIPYFNLLLLNTGQAVIAIFLASDFLKRDKKLDTSEVFYVRPLSNAEYLIGKIWGNLRVFLILNVIIMGISLLLSFMAPDVTVDWISYVIYFFLICIPTLLYIIGLSIFLMLVLKNQALTFILLLGYIGLTLFYVNDKFYYLFDYMAYYLPMMKSSIVGFTNLEAILIHRGIYFFAGLGFIFLTISLFNRLPNSRRSSYPWLFLAFCMFILTGIAGYKHVHSILKEGEMRILYTEINNKYVHTPKMVIDTYDIDVKQHSDSFFSEIRMTGKPLEKASVFTFCLNPGLTIEDVTEDGKALSFERDGQIVLVDFNRAVPEGDTVAFTIRYKGKIDNSFCYLDIPEEILQQEYRTALFSSDKQYSFLTHNYMLLTPETYWYPRPGTAYSTESPDWQQSYFSRFNLKVTPLPGLVALSQGEAAGGEDGSYSFTPEYPLQALSLIAGNYKEQSFGNDSIRYSVWHIEGHDYYRAAFDSIIDTIPSLVHNFQENIERTYKLNYPFNRFSIVEVPAQFYSYTHAWSQAQEVVQPEMVLFTEKGWTFDQFDMVKRKKNQIRWAKRGGQDINEQEAQIRTFNEIISLFSRPEGNNNFSSTGRGGFNITSQPNPYFLFPLLYNFKYNIFSPQWPVANRVIELYLQNKPDNDSWQREINGLSNNEKANNLMEKQNFKELLANTEYRDLMNNVIGLKANWLFSPSEINLGVQAFRDTVYALLERNLFRNIQFESVLDTLGMISHTDIRSKLIEWDSPTPLPLYSIGQPDIKKVTHRGQETFVMKITISNNSGYDGIVHLNTIESGRRDEKADPRTNRKITLAAHETKQLVSVWENAPREIIVNTLISGNLPNMINLPVGNIRQERGSNIEKEGDYILPSSEMNIPGEVIVDNEDSLFSVSAAPLIGLLPKLLDKEEDTSFKYSGIWWWRPPLKWTATTNAGYYGKYIRSAYVIKSGNGTQSATWKVPVPSEGHYEVYYHLYKDGDARHNNRSDVEYHFKIHHDDETEEAYLNLRRANDGWEQLGVYYFGSDTIRVELTNECKQRSVTADAVKIVKR